MPIVEISQKLGCENSSRCSLLSIKASVGRANSDHRQKPLLVAIFCKSTFTRKHRRCLEVRRANHANNCLLRFGF